MRRILCAIIVCLGLSVPAAAETAVYSLGVRGGLSTLTGGVSPKTAFHPDFGLTAGYRLHAGWLLELDLSHYNLPNDTLLTSSFGFAFSNHDAIATIKATGIGITLSRCC